MNHENSPYVAPRRSASFSNGGKLSRSASDEHLAGWTPSSWQSFPIKQQPEYKDKEKLAKAVAKIATLPPLVHPKEIETLKERLANASLGKCFLLQGGDCAERFVDCNKNSIENKFKILLQMSLIILFSSRMPVVRIARLAGQYAKPRTSDHETVNGQKVYSYKGDNINGFHVDEREPDPQRLVEAYFHSGATLNYVRAMIQGGVADLHNPRSWRLEDVQEHSIRKEYESMIDKITDALDFLGTIDMDQGDALRSVELFTSHEGMLLNYEEALTHAFRNRYYNCGAHYLWIGDRTRELTGAHIEYFRGIANPIGVKVGPSMKAEELQQLVLTLNPKKELGRLTLITRYGVSQVENLLPGHIRAVKATGIPVLWICDPCHGNTEQSKSGVKTRNVEKMMNELLFTFDVHRREGTILGGVHLELTGDNVTECIGGSSALDHFGLSENYETTCDPRLNYTQSLDVAFVIASKLKEMHRLKNLKPFDA